MLRSIIASSRVAATGLRPYQTNFLRSTIISGQNNTIAQFQQVKFYSHAPELTKEIISERIIELLESYSKTKKDVEINSKTSFSKDLGLDSFDIVEVVMEIEYEFSVLIPDKEADEIKTVGQAVEYISKQSDAC